MMENFKPAPSCSDTEEYGSLRAGQALEMVLDCVRPVQGIERIPLPDAVDRVLSEDVVSGIDVPRHTNSAVDGYAIRVSDLIRDESAVGFRVIDTALAGKPARLALKPLTAIRIMTGAIMPEGADSVVMQEHVEITGETVCIHSEIKKGENVREAGEDMRKGESVLKPGRLCTPADIGLIASLGFGEITVRRRVRIGVLSTGSEIRDIGMRLKEGELYDSNRYTLQAALQSRSIEISDYGIVPDDRNQLEKVLTLAGEENDMVISTGGVSVGKADHTRTIFETIGDIQFSRVAIKPGRPLTFARVGPKAFFGLPGNPVAVMVTFYQFVLPALRKMMGISPPSPVFSVTARSLSRLRKKPGRTEYQRGILERSEDGQRTVRLTGRQGSGILRSMSMANALIVLPHDAASVDVGEEVQVQPFTAFRV